MIQTDMNNANNNIKVEITRLDVVKGTSETGAYAMMSSLNNTNQITNINEVETIVITGDIDFLFNQMPKSYQWKKSTFSLKGEIIGYMSVSFNTFWMDKTTGDLNETAFKRRMKVVAKLKELGF